MNGDFRQKGSIICELNEILRAKEPKNMEARKRRAEYILKEEEMKAECIAAGRDWNIEKLR